MTIKETHINRLIMNLLKVVWILINLFPIIIINNRKETKEKLKEHQILNNLNPISDIYNIDEAYLASNANSYLAFNKLFKDLDMKSFELGKLSKDEKETIIKKKEQYEHILTYNRLKNKPKDTKDSLIEEEKKTILQTYYNSISNQDINIIFDFGYPFGNQIAALNKLIFYCEIIHCTNIYLPENNNLYINHTLYDHDLTIVIGSRDTFDNANEISSLSPNFFFDFYNLRIDNRVEIFKNEILNNLPKINISKNDLIIHFRSSDIFQHEDDAEYAPDYSQPPLCFYLKILKQFKFSKIYIISADDIYNPVIKKLREKYPEIIYNDNPLEVDISYLARGYNIVGSISSFLISSIKLNDNLEYLWEYDIYPMSGKLFHNHYSINNEKRNYTIYQMKPSDMYKKKMIIWKSSKEQIKIMLNDQCPNKFITIKPNIF